MRSVRWHVVTCCALGLLLVNCGKDSTSPSAGPPATLAKIAGDNQTAIVGAAVAASPSVKVSDASGTALSGIAVTFAVASGSGAITGGTATTSATGIATLGGWTLGNTAGANTVTATISASGVSGNPATFTATATAGAPKTLTKQSGDNTTGSAGVAVTAPPAVKVVDQFGNAVSGVAVTFAVATGAGTLTGATATTGADGVATIGSWTLGAVAGVNTLTATIAATGVTGNPATFTATANAGAPKTLTKQAGDNVSAAAGAAVAAPPTVKIVDQFNNPVAGLAVTFAVASGGGSITGGATTTAADGTARVGSWTLGATPGVNTLTATVAPAGVTGNPATFTATGTVAAFNPTSNTTISGTNTFSSINIPVGVTVSVTSDAVLTSNGSVTIAGTLAGDCVVVSVTANALLNVSGTIDNGCTTAPSGTPPSMTLVGKTGYHFTGGGRVTSSGDINVTNDVTLPTSIVASSGLVAPSIRRGAALRSAALIDYDCESNNFTWIPKQPTARDGANGGQTGGVGVNGRVWTLGCRGNGLINNTTVTGQHGGRGGLGTHTSATAATSTGGAGGNGGLLLVHVTDQLDFTGTNTLNGGNGGNGGVATATGQQNPATPTGPPAAANGGKGGDAATITVRSLGAMTIAGSVTFNVGRGGVGGDATAVAADGVNSTLNAPAQPGGVATANGGDGGIAPNRQLSASGNIGGGGTISVTGAQGGVSGLADAYGGKGGDGVVIQNRNGAVGGAINVRAGRGGNSETRNLAGALVGPGGNSADAFVRGGIGGNGYNDCTVPLTLGGTGGKGGDATGGTRFGGTGATNGIDGTTREISNSNGGVGGHGLGPGKGGNGGANVLGTVGAPVITAPVFTNGVGGRGCRFTVVVRVLTDPSPSHEQFVGYTSITIIDALVNNDNNTITFVGNAGGKFISTSGTWDALTGAFVTGGSGIAAGIPNVPATFIGTINLANGTLNGVVTLSGSASTPPGGLPGHGTTYEVTGSVSGASPPLN